MNLTLQHIIGVVIGGAVSGLFFYALGQHDGKQDAAFVQLKETVQAERERVKDDATAQSLNDYDFCRQSFSRRGLQLSECEQLRGVAAK